MKRLQQGFTLIELMIVVAIVGILAAIALPAYQDYVIRSKMSEGVVALAACKTSIAEYVSTKTTMPADADVAGCSNVATQYVASLTFDFPARLPLLPSARDRRIPARRAIASLRLSADVDVACRTFRRGRVRTRVATRSTCRRTSVNRIRSHQNRLG